MAAAWHPAPPNRILSAASLILLLTAVFGVFGARNWPLVHDAPLIHYVVFLMDHGRAPYRDILEMNMPGTYMLEWIVMHTLGGGATAWWLWDAVLGAATVLASCWIAGPARRAVGVAAGALAYLVHLSDGPMNLGQRDFVVAVLLLLAMGSLFASLRHDRPSWMAAFMIFCGTAASIKPPVIAIAAAFAIAACWERRRLYPATQRTGAMLGWSLAGLMLPTAASLLFLVRWNVIPDFLTILHGLVPWYASLQRLPLGEMIVKIQPWRLRPVTAGAAVLFVLSHGWRRWESNFLLAGLFSGIALFLIQRKGWSYHLYTEVAFLCLWALFQIDLGLRAGRLQRLLALVTLAFIVLLGAGLLYFEHKNTYPMETASHLQADLESLGGPALSGHVQCLDMTRGSCIDVLYRLKLVQSTGVIYDFELFPEAPNPVALPIQARFLREIAANPPRVIVLSSHTWPGDLYSYDQLDRWPAFRDLLQQNYRLDHELPLQPNSAGYRIYLLQR